LEERISNLSSFTHLDLTVDWKCGFIQSIEERMQQCSFGRNPRERIIGEHFLQHTNNCTFKMGS